MPRAIGRHAEVLLPRGGVNSARPRIEAAGFIHHSNSELCRVANNHRVQCVRLIFFRCLSINLRTVHAFWLWLFGNRSEQHYSIRFSDQTGWRNNTAK